MGSSAYELGRQLAVEKCAGFVDGLARGGAWLGGKALGYGKSLLPKFVERAPNVVSHAGGARTFGEGVRSVGSGLLHGISGGRFMPKGVVADVPFHYARGITDAFARHPYFYTGIGQMAGVIPEPVANAIYAARGLGSREKGLAGLMDKAFGAWSAYDLGKYALGGGQQMPQAYAEQPIDYHDLASGLMVGREAMQSPAWIPEIPQPQMRRAWRTVSGMMPGQVGSRY